MVRGGVNLPLSAQTRHADPFKERFEAVLMVFRGFGGGLDEGADVGDVHVCVASHARGHLRHCVRLGVGHRPRRGGRYRWTCDTNA